MDTAHAARQVLVVEDDQFIAEVLVDIPQDEGYRAAASVDGDAVAIARDDPPGLVLLDVMMPEMDGPEVCRRLNADPRTRRVPVVLMTAVPESVLGKRLAGCAYEAVISKPFSLDDVLTTVERHLAAG